jgi:hypothetical protein
MNVVEDVLRRLLFPFRNCLRFADAWSLSYSHAMPSRERRASMLLKPSGLRVEENMTDAYGNPFLIKDFQKLREISS